MFPNIPPVFYDSFDTPSPTVLIDPFASTVDQTMKLFTQHRQAIHRHTPIVEEEVDPTERDWERIPPEVPFNRLEQDDPPAKYLMTSHGYRQMMNHLGHWPGWEDGGYLFAPAGTAVGTTFIPDRGGEQSSASLRLNLPRAKRYLSSSKLFALTLMAVIHSHPSGCDRLSQPDLVYARNLFLNPKNNVRHFWMPIVVDGELIPYLLSRDEPMKPQRRPLEIV